MISFTQSTWSKKNIDFNTEKRIQAKRNKNAAEKDFFKLMNNAVYGKFIENVKNRINFEIRTNEDDVQKLINSPRIQNYRIFNEKMIGIEMRKKKIVLNKPKAIGFSILECSKRCMYDFYYNRVKPQYGERAELLYTDTDSLVLNIQCEDWFEEMRANAQWYDLSEIAPRFNRFPGMSVEEIGKNSAVVGKFKDESEGKVISEFVSVKAKMYSYLAIDGEKQSHTSKGKGVPKPAMKKVHHQKYLDCIHYRS